MPPAAVLPAAVLPAAALHEPNIRAGAPAGGRVRPGDPGDRCPGLWPRGADRADAGAGVVGIGGLGRLALGRHPPDGLRDHAVYLCTDPGCAERPVWPPACPADVSRRGGDQLPAAGLGTVADLA